MNLDNAQALHRAQWVEGYRLTHRDAERWADGRRAIRHSLETQERIFRMAEQLRRDGDWPAQQPLFSILRALDDAARWESAANEPPPPASAAAAALVGYKVLFDSLPPVRDHDWPEGFEVADQADAELTTFRLRLEGFDPIVFDGADPAAYLWALFEMRERNAAWNEAKQALDSRIQRPRGLAVIASGSASHQKPAHSAAHRALQPAGVAR